MGFTRLAISVLFGVVIGIAIAKGTAALIDVTIPLPQHIEDALDK